jgi:hypothetical protein
MTRITCIGLAFLAVFLLGAAGSAGGTALHAAAGCDWAYEFDSALAQVGEHRKNWTLVDLTENYALADTAALTVEFNPEVPCDRVSSIVRHEWMHLQQARHYGSYDAMLTAYAGDASLIELVADCGSQLLGSIYLPYLSQGWECTAWALGSARILIDPLSV